MERWLWHCPYSCTTRLSLLLHWSGQTHNCSTEEMALAWVAENIWAGSLCGGFDLWLWSPWDSGDLLGPLTEAGVVQWPGCDPWVSLLGRRPIKSSVSRSSLCSGLWEVISWLLLSVCGSVGGRQQGSPGWAVIAVPMTHVFNFPKFSPENAILVFPQCFAEAGLWMKKRWLKLEDLKVVPDVWETWPRSTWD